MWKYLWITSTHWEIACLFIERLLEKTKILDKYLINLILVMTLYPFNIEVIEYTTQLDAPWVVLGRITNATSIRKNYLPYFSIVAYSNVVVL